MITALLFTGCGSMPSSISTPSQPIEPDENISARIRYLNPARYRVEQSVAVRNNGFDLDKFVMYQARPVEWRSQKSMRIISVSPPPTQESRTSTHGNKIYFWRLHKTPRPGETVVFDLQFELTSMEIRSAVEPDVVLPYKKGEPFYTNYTRAERFIEATNSAIVEIADRITEEESNPLSAARRFYDFVIDTAEYKVLGEGLRGASKLLDTGIGECGDYSALFVALCRAAGIPARPVVGYWAVSGIEQTHVWAEFYIEPFGWVPVDPTTGQLNPESRDYYFGNLDNKRVILNKGFNIRLVPAAPGDYITPFLQVPMYWFWGKGDQTNVTVERTGWEVKGCEQ